MKFPLPGTAENLLRFLHVMNSFFVQIYGKKDENEFEVKKGVVHYLLSMFLGSWQHLLCILLASTAKQHFILCISLQCMKKTVFNCFFKQNMLKLTGMCYVSP